MRDPRAARSRGRARVAGLVTLSVMVFASTGAFAATFSDVPETHPFHEEIEWFASEGIGAGYPDGTFGPKASMTRQTLTAFFFNYLDPEFTPPMTATFPDVGVAHPFFTQIEWAASEGIVSGYSDGTFGPRIEVTRQVMAAMLFDLHAPAEWVPPATATFSDVAVGSTFFAAIEWMVARDISTGYPDGTFGTRKILLPQEAAAFFYRYDQKHRTLTVNTTDDGSDFFRGDGICEMTPGAGDCSLRAAIDEVNHHPAWFTVEIPAGRYFRNGSSNDDLNLEGDLDLDPMFERVELEAIGTAGAASIEGNWGAVDVHGGEITIRGLQISGHGSWAGVSARSGTLLLEDTTVHDTLSGLVIEAGVEVTAIRSRFEDNTRDGVVVESGGVLRSENSAFSDNGYAGIANEGVVEAAFTTISRNTSAGVSGSGSLYLTASVITDQRAGADCDVPADSFGWNLDFDGSCGLDQDTDQSGPWSGLDPIHQPMPGSPVLDVISVGTGPCTGGTDLYRTQRPQGLGCDIGAVEAPPLEAAFVVDNTTDAGDAILDGICDDGAGHCTLRAAIDEADADPTPSIIVIQPGIGPFLDQSIFLSTSVRIEGNGADLSMSDTRIGRMITVGPDAHAHLLDLSVTRYPDGLTEQHKPRYGGIESDGALTLEQVVIANQYAETGAGVLSRGVLRIDRSTIRDNTADSVDGYDHGIVCFPLTGCGRYFEAWNRGAGAGVYSDGSAVILRSTISNNRAGLFAIGEIHYLYPVEITPEGQGGAIDAQGILTVESSTISGNLASNSGAAVASRGSSTRILRSTLVSESNVAPMLNQTDVIAEGSVFAGWTCPNPLASGSTSHNVTNHPGCELSGPDDVTASDLLLGPLADNGGSTHTHAPLAGSPVLDAIPPGTGNLCALDDSEDQRGEPRPVGGFCDIGSVEWSGPLLAGPTTYTVTSTTDAVDVAPGDGTCETAIPGECTLRAAFQEAAAAIHVGRPEIVLQSSATYVLSIAGLDEDESATGDLDVNGALRIHGNGSTIDAAGLDRVLDLRGHQVDTTVIDNLTITGGLTDQEGGGIRLINLQVWVMPIAKTAELNNVSLVDNTANRGGGLYTHSQENEPDADYPDGYGHVTVTGGTLSDNTATANGGGLYVSDGHVTLIGVSVERNRAEGDGGSARGGGVYFRGISPPPYHRIYIIESTFEENIAASALVPPSGGAIYGEASIEQSTFVSNIAQGTWFSTGGALAGSGEVIASTFSDNMAATGRALDGPWDVTATLIESRHGVSSCSANVVTSGWNLVADTSCAFGAIGDVTGVDPMLGTIADNGGPTRTVLIDPLSPAVDAIPGATLGLCDGSFPSDQRAQPRPVGTACDIGAVERQPGDP